MNHIKLELGQCYGEKIVIVWVAIPTTLSTSQTHPHVRLTELQSDKTAELPLNLSSSNVRTDSAPKDPLKSNSIATCQTVTPQSAQDAPYTKEAGLHTRKHQHAPPKHFLSIRLSGRWTSCLLPGLCPLAGDI